MSQFQIPTISPATDLDTLRRNISVALSNLVSQLNGQPDQVSGANKRVTDVSTPTGPNDAVNKRYLDDAISGINQRPLTSGNAGVGVIASYSVTRESYATLTLDEIQATQSGDTSVIAISVDETDVGWHGFTSAITSIATSFLGTVTGTSRLLSTASFRVGDYIVWNDPLGGTANTYEINRIKAISGATYTLYSGPVVGTRSAYFGSTNVAHATATTFYKALPYTFAVNVKNTPGEKIELLHANKCVLAVNTPATNQKNWLNLNQTSTGTTQPHPAPGLRTLNGAAYHIGISTSGIAANQHADFKIKVQAWESVRCVYGYVTTAPTTAPMVVQVIYTNGSNTGLIDIFTIGTGSTVSYGTLMPDGINMPFHGTLTSTWTPPTTTNYDWPPNILPGTSTIPGPGIVMAPDGFIDLIVTTAGGAGQLVATVQT